MNIASIAAYHESYIRLTFFAATFGLVALGEFLSPRRSLGASKQKRWGNNILLIIIDTVILRLVFPIFPVGVAVFCAQKGWGILHILQAPFWFALLCGIVFLDLTIYFQHKMFHLLSVFWRLHKVHHIDQDIDVTTGLRFHPLEMIVSMIIKIAAVVAIGAPAISVVIFEILLNGTTMFNHGNLNIPAVVDRFVRLLIVTPDMHRVHHSVIRKETNSNYGFNFSWWDRLFGTYRPEPEGGHLQMKIGLNGYHKPEYLKLLPMLVIPFTPRKEY